MYRQESQVKSINIVKAGNLNSKNNRQKWIWDKKDKRKQGNNTGENQETDQSQTTREIKHRI